VVLLRQVIAAKTRRPPVDSATCIVRQPLNFFDEPLDSNRRARGTRGTRPLVPDASRVDSDEGRRSGSRACDLAFAGGEGGDEPGTTL